MVPVLSVTPPMTMSHFLAKPSHPWHHATYLILFATWLLDCQPIGGHLCVINKISKTKNLNHEINFLINRRYGDQHS